MTKENINDFIDEAESPDIETMLDDLEDECTIAIAAYRRAKMAS